MTGRMVPAMAIVSSTATAEYRGSFMSFSSAVQNLTAGLASLTGGLIVTVEAGRFVHYETVGYLAIAFSVLALLASRKIPRGQI